MGRTSGEQVDRVSRERERERKRHDGQVASEDVGAGTGEIS